MKSMLEKLKENEPYNLFFTTVADFPETATQKNAVNFTDLLCPSLGELQYSVQLNFLMEIDWLMEQYDKMDQGKKPLTVLYGYEVECPEKYGDKFSSIEEYIKYKYPNVQARYVKTKDPYGIHHSKIGIYVYKDNSLRIVISTANLYSIDWDFYCNGLWISPLCPPLPENSKDTAGAGPTNFKPALLSYLDQYQEPLLDECIDYIKKADFSAVKVCLVTSAPGLHKPTGWPVAHCHLHSVGKLLSLHCKLPGISPLHNKNTSAKDKQATTTSKGRITQWTNTRADSYSEKTTANAETSNTRDKSTNASNIIRTRIASDESTTAIDSISTTSSGISSVETQKTVIVNETTTKYGTAVTSDDVIATVSDIPTTSSGEVTIFNKTPAISPTNYGTSEKGPIETNRTMDSTPPIDENVTKEEETNTIDETLSWEIMAQASSIGHLGNSSNEWLSTALLRSLASHTHCRLPRESDATLKIIYPTENDILLGHHGAAGGGCCCYWMDFSQENLKWPLKYLHSWKADDTNRSKATPHIKTYCRISPCLTQLAWFLLTSANISKSAWGSGVNKHGSIYVRSYEAGVLFLPKYFGETYFQIKSEITDEAVKLFPVIYDLPLTPYGTDDEPWSHLKKE